MLRYLTDVAQPMLPFGPALKMLLEKRGISASELARMMAYKSRNSIFRILDGEGGDSARKAFYDRLIEEDPLALSDEERAQLTQAMEISRVGLDVFVSNCALAQLLTSNAPRKDVQEVCILDGEKQPRDLRNVLKRSAGGKKAYLTITGCCNRAVFEMLQRELCADHNLNVMKITHFIYAGADEIVQNIAAIQPLLYLDCYEVRCLEPGMLSRERESIYRCNCIYLHMQEGDGRWYDQQFLLIDPSVFLPLRRIESAGEKANASLFAMDTARMPLLKTPLAQSGSLESYLNWTEACLKMEQDRTIYTIKPDVLLSFVPPDVLQPCFLDGVQSTALTMDGEMEARVAALRRVHIQRFENIFSKRKVSRTIFDREAMERFARTGRQSDHFFACRPYTSAERVRILEHLRKQMAENPYFSVYFFKPGIAPSMAEVGLYEGVGTLMVKPNTNYDLTGDHGETIITQDAFCQRYKAFFTQVLLEQFVLGEQETLDVLDALIEIAKHA